MRTDCKLPWLEVRIIKQTDAPEVTLIPTENDDATWGLGGHTWFDAGRSPADADAVVEIPWAKSIYGDLDTMADYFLNLGQRLDAARKNYRAGLRTLGTVDQ